MESGKAGKIEQYFYMKVEVRSGRVQERIGHQIAGSGRTHMRRWFEERLGRRNSGIFGQYKMTIINILDIFISFIPDFA